VFAHFDAVGEEEEEMRNREDIEKDFAVAFDKGTRFAFVKLLLEVQLDIRELLESIKAYVDCINEKVR